MGDLAPMSEIFFVRLYRTIAWVRDRPYAQIPSKMLAKQLTLLQNTADISTPHRTSPAAKPSILRERNRAATGSPQLQATSHNISITSVHVYNERQILSDGENKHARVPPVTFAQDCRVKSAACADGSHCHQCMRRGLLICCFHNSDYSFEF